MLTSSSHSLVLRHPENEEDWCQIFSLLYPFVKNDVVCRRFPNPKLRFFEYTWNDDDFDKNLHTIALHEGRVCGAIGFTRRPWKTSRKDYAFLQYFIVSPPYQNKGIGSLLWSASLPFLKEQGVKKIELFSSSPNYIWCGLPESFPSSFFSFLKKLGFSFPSLRHDIIYSWVHLLKDPKDKTQWETHLENSLVSINRKMSHSNIIIYRITENHTPPAFIKKALDWIQSTFSKSWRKEIAPSIRKGKVLIALHLNDVSSFKAGLEEDRSSLALEQGECIGFAAFDATNYGWLGPVGVKKEWRRKAIGSALVINALYVAYHVFHTASWIIPWVNTENIQFYKRALPPASFEIRTLRKGISLLS